MTFKGFLALAALAALPLTASAQTALPPLHATPIEPFVYQTAAEIEALTKGPDGKPRAAIVSDHENTMVEYVTRGANTNPETHGHWYDYIHVLSGEGSVIYGGTQDGGKDTGQQEIRGGAVVGGKTIILHPGDRLVIPPGQPHLFTAAPGKTLTYLVFKQRV